MNNTLFLMGITKVLFGIVVGALGILFASRVVGLFLRWGNIDEEIRKGSPAAGILKASALIALGLLVQNAVSATFNAMDLLYRGRPPELSWITSFALYALYHVGISLAVGSCVLALGAILFNRLTKDVDEMEEVRKGNIASAIVLGSVMIVMALMTAPGLQTALDGLLPFPELARDEMLAPS